jgi:hypothetical protein
LPLDRSDSSAPAAAALVPPAAGRAALAGLLTCTGLLTATALVPPAAGGVSPPLPPGRSDLSAAAALDLSARLPFSDLAAAATSLVPPAAGGVGPLFRCSRRAFPAAAALVPPAAGGAGAARPLQSSSSQSLRQSSPSCLARPPARPQPSSPAVWPSPPRISPWLRAGRPRTPWLCGGCSSARAHSLAPPVPFASPSASHAAPPACVYKAASISSAPLHPRIFFRFISALLHLITIP